MSRVTHVPVTPSVLAWAIKESGYEPTQLASAVGVSIADIQEWLSGKALPNLTQAKKLARKLRRSLAALLLPKPPQSRPLAVEFRHSLTDRQELNPNERRYLRRARRFQETLSWLSREFRASTAHHSLSVVNWCDSFSAQLLMPTDEVLATLREFGWLPGRQISDLAVARRIAAAYRVSLRAATIRLIDLEAANWSLYNQIPPISDDKPRGGGGGGRDRTQIREDQLGERTTSVLVRAVQRDVLERFQAVEMLDIPDSKFDQLAAASTHIQ